MDEPKAVAKQDGTAAERFTAIVLREFNGLTGTNLGLTDFQKKLAQHLFVKVDVALKSFEAKRKGGAAPYTWANVNLDKLAVDAIYRIDLGLDALIPNHIHPVPYFNERAGKYDLDLRVGYVGKDYYHRRFAVDPPVAVVYELVYDTDKFKPIKNSDGSSKYEFEITQPFARGGIVGGFGYVIYEDPRKNQLIIVSEDDFQKSRKLARSQEFWENFPTEMRLKTLVHRVTDKIPLDPQKTNKSYAAVEEEEGAIEGTFREIPTSLEELPIFPAATASKKELPPAVPATAVTDDLANHRSSIVELAQKYLGPDAYEKTLCPFFLSRFEKQGISGLTIDELGATDKWLAEQINLMGGVKPSGQSAEATKVAGEVAAKSKPRTKAKPEKEKAPAKTEKPTKSEEKPAEPTKVGMDQVVKLGKEMRAKQYSDDEIKEVLFKATGKKAKWDNNDAPAIRKAIDEKEAKKAATQLAPTPIADEVEKFLEEQKE